MSICRCVMFCALFLCGISLHATPVTEVHAQDPLKNRKPGEEVRFTVKAMEDGKLLKNGVLEISIQENGIPAKKIELDLAEGNPREITASMRKSGFLTCRTWAYRAPGKKTVYVYGRDTVPFEPEKLTADVAAPADFDAFWEKVFRNALETPPDFQLKTLTQGVPKTHTAYLLSFALGKERMYGFLSVPSGSAQAKYPAVLRIPGAGPGFTAPRFQPGVITLQMNIHCIDPSDKTFFRSEYAKIDKPRPYQARNAAVPEKYYLARVVPGLCRAVDYLAARPDWNGRSLVVAGSSQGGALSLMCAAFSGKITAVSASIPAFGDQNGRFSARAPGWPNLYSVMVRFEKQLPDAERKRICGYFDLVNFVPKIKAPVNMNCGAIDIVCPPHSVYAVYNRITAPKEMLLMQGTSHMVSREGSLKNEAFMKKDFAK